MPIVLSIGELVDRLAIANLKIWHMEDQMKDPDIPDMDKAKIQDQIVSQNTFRMKVVAAIDEYYE